MHADIDQIIEDLTSDLEAEKSRVRRDEDLCYSLRMAIGGLRLVRNRTDTLNGDDSRVWEEHTVAAVPLSPVLMVRAREIVNQKAA